jgi:hypothetical protein
MTSKVFYTVTNGFGSTTDTIVVTVVHRPILTVTGPASVSVSQNYWFRGAPGGGTFTASNPAVGDFIAQYDSTATGHQVTLGSFIMVAAGVDTIHYRLTNMCGTTDSIFIVSLILNNHVNGVNGNVEEIKLFPNPTNSEFMLGLHTDLNEAASVVITNVAGEKVKSFNMTTNKSEKVTLDVPAGVYFLNATTASGSSFSGKITITK